MATSPWYRCRAGLDAMTDASSIPTFEMAPGYRVPRVINGCWQLTPDHSGGRLDRAELVAGFFRLADAGLTAFDCADIYTGVEELLGEFLSSWRAAGRDPGAVQVHTKYVPDLASLAGLTRADVERAIDRSLRRLGVERLDLVQFHWWDESVPGFEETVGWLAELQTAGKIRCLGLTNVGTAALQALADRGVEIAANQVQYSLMDRRPEHGLSQLVGKTGTRLLCYGALAGGFLSDRYRGAPPPAEPQSNRSLTKYRLIVEEYGGWRALQELLELLAAIAAKHSASLANVAARWVLDQPRVGAIILGASRRDRLNENARVFAFELDGSDREALERLCSTRPGPEGDIYELERDRSSPHWAILRTALHTS